MANPILTLFERIEPAPKGGMPADECHQMSFVGDIAVMLVTRPSTKIEGMPGGRDDEIQIQVLFGGHIYRFPPTEKNREAVRMFLGKLGGLG